MGIQGLLPFLKKIHTPVNVSQFQGCTVAIDAYCWLHKGAFSCADKLAMGEKTDQYVYYCMKYVDYLLRNGLKPILVFDGCHLPSKKDVETARRERREVNRKRAAQLLREGKRVEAKECLQRCVDITPQMALELMNVCRARGVDCIVAPYEADAQLAYLNKAGIAQIIITEDSDLLLFGCEKVIFKMDLFGNGVMIEKSRLNEVVDIQDGFYTFDKFRYMCILSGCDYLPSLPGIGLAKACKVFKIARQTDIRQVLKKLPSYLKMNLVVPNEYVDNFVKADNTFLYQLAFDPVMKRLCPLNPYPPEVDKHELTYAGSYFSNDLAYQIALGNIDIHTHEKIADFDPKSYKPKYAKKQESEQLCMLSIWHPSYRPRSKNHTAHSLSDDVSHNRPSLAGKEVQVKNTLTKKSPVKRVRPAEESEAVKTDSELVDLYTADEPQQKRVRHSAVDENASLKTVTKHERNPDSDSDAQDSPYKSRRKGSKKKVLSPSELQNCKEESESSDDEGEDETNCGNSRKKSSSSGKKRHGLGNALAELEEKENGKALTPRVNKFAVSALAKRAKFSLDAPKAGNVKVEVKSRYFGSSGPSSSSAGASAVESSPTSQTETTDPPVKTSGSSDFLSSESSDSTANEQNQNDVSCDTTPKTASNTLARFGHNASPKKPRTSPKSNVKNSSSKTTSKSTKSAAANKASPGSIFNWTQFKFTKCSSTPNLLETSLASASSSANKPFKRVSSDSFGLNKDGCHLKNQAVMQKASLSASQLDSSDAQNQETFTAESFSSSQSQTKDDGVFATPSNIQTSETDSTADFDARQQSNLYSIDSDCFPTSQDFVDLTDAEGDEQLSSEDRTSGGAAGDVASPSLSLKMPFASPKSSTRLPSAGTGAKKCRVSGLSRGKKKLPAGGDEKQQKIKDMFSRFARDQKEKLISTTPETKILSSDGIAAEACTPTDPALSHPTAIHRKLCL